jgi:hypothetical protein
VGVHKNGKWMNYPLGVLANADLRSAKKLAHSQFDLLWKTGLMTRPESYKWLQELLNKTEPDAHIGELTFDECLLVYNKAKETIQQSYKI